ncbi:MAG: T9SS type A sorting domain-containing protein, partial [Bacteroidales bacterium]|nr:T9SS type A sorting domain-containing protein [Bacteroidales bacterium]
GECSATAVAPTTTDACAGSITGTTGDAMTYSIVGTHVITWTFDDGNGNSIDVDQNVLVADVTDPVIPTLPDVTGACSATAGIPTTTDVCAGTITGSTTDALTYVAQGTHVITWTFDDGNGNRITVDQNVIVDDVTAPTATAPADVASCDGTVSSIGLTAVMDNCTTPVVTYVLSGATTGTGTGADASAELFSPGATTVTYTVDDGNGNSTEYSLIVTYVVVDDIVVTVSGGALTCETTGTYQWINCADNSIIAGETASTYRPGVNGEYAVILTQSGCSDTSDCFSLDYTGIDDNRSQDYKVYPNPAQEYVTIEMVNEQTNATIQVIDMTGQIIQVEELDRFIQTDLDVSRFKAGVYLIQIRSDQVNSVARMIKE